MKKIILLVPTLLLALNATANAFPQTVQLEKETLQLNGTGLRTATFLKIKVYDMALYLEEKSDSPEAILNAKGNKRIEMHFLRNVPKEKLNNAWIEGFKKNGADLEEHKTTLEQLQAPMRDMQKDDRLVFEFTKKKTKVLINDKEVAVIKGSDFQQALLAVWLGPNPPNESLKKGILGLE